MKKRSLALVALVLLLTVAVGGTVAWLVADTTPVTNVFAPAHVTCVIDETFDGTTKKDVKVQNTGNIDAYIRATYVVNWVKDGNIYAVAPTAGDYTIDLNIGNTAGTWKQLEDGYYYYNGRVAPEAFTANLINSCTPVEGKAPAGYTLQVTILAEAIQADGGDGTTSAVKLAWGYDYTTNRGWTA